MVFGQGLYLVLKLKLIVVPLVMEAKAMDLYAPNIAPPPSLDTARITRERRKCRRK